MSQAVTTTDHDAIKTWVEGRGGWPAAICETTSEGDAGLLRIDFEEPTIGFVRLAWEDFFAKFDEAKLAFLHQDETADGSTSRFCKFVSREDS